MPKKIKVDSPAVVTKFVCPGCGGDAYEVISDLPTSDVNQVQGERYLMKIERQRVRCTTCDQIGIAYHLHYKGAE